MMKTKKLFGEKTKLSHTKIMIVLLALFTFFVACSDDDENGSERISEIAGNWTATKATFNGEDVIENGGEVTLSIQENGRFTFTIQRPDKNNLVFTGKLWFDEEWLAVEYDTNKGEVEYYDISYDATSLHIGANSEFDFDGDGSDEIVIFFLDMVR